MLNNMFSGLPSMNLPTDMNFIGGGSMNTTTIIMAFAIFMIVGVLYYVYYFLPSTNNNYKPNSEIDANSKKGINGNNNSGRGVNSSSIDVILFFATWCPHCKTAKPVFEKVQQEYQDKKINGKFITFTEVDCSEETPEIDSMMKKYNVEGYPTIKMNNNGNIISFDTKPTYENLVNFINSST